MISAMALILVDSVIETLLDSKPKLMCRPAVGVADLSFSKDEH